MFYVHYDPDYKPVSYSNVLQALQAKANNLSNANICVFDTNIVYDTGHFFIGTLNKEKVCHECIREKDPQALNILTFIKKGNNLQAQLEKLGRGMDKLRKEIAVYDPLAKKCPLCKIPKVYQEIVNGKKGWMCLNCKIGYQGNGQFFFNGKVYNINQVRKLIKMKAFT